MKLTVNPTKMPMTNKKKGTWVILGPVLALCGVLFARTVIGMVGQETGNTPQIESANAVLNFLALILVITLIFAIPIGLLVMFRKDADPKESILATLPENQRPHPWRRYFARTVDMWLVGLAIMVPILFGASEETIDQIPDQALGLAVALILLPVEAAFLSNWNRTPGKWMFSISVTKDGKPLAFEQALNRAFLVWMRGMGFGISIVAFFANIHQYSTLMTKGITSWDRELGTTVTYEKLSVGRVLLALLLLLSLVFLTVAGTFADALLAQ